MGKKKGANIVVGLVVAGLFCSNTYTFMKLNNTKDELKEEIKESKEFHEQMDILVSQDLNKSSEYASHEDMMYAFNIYSASNRITYKGTNYYADIKHVISHTFNEKEKIKYIAQAEMTFLKDKTIDEASYIQNRLPAKIMEESKKLAKKTNHEADGEHTEETNSDVLIPQTSMIAIEKKAKEEFVIHKWNQVLSFNMDSQVILKPSTKMEEEILKEFIKSVVLKENDNSGNKTEIEIENSQTVQIIKVYVEGRTLTFTYNKDTKKLSEEK